MQPHNLKIGADKVRVCLDFEAQILRMRKQIYSLAFRMLGNRHDAEDITQETLVRAWASYASYDPKRSFEKWICRIAVNLCIDHMRYRKHRQMMSLDTLWGTDQDQEAGGLEPADSSNDPAERLLAEEIDERLQRVFMTLPASYRQCVLLLEQDHTYKEIADMMQCPLGTIRSRIHRARDRVREAMSAPSTAA